MTLTPRIYLASTSPRRRELLRQIGINFDVLTFRAGERGEDADVDETPLPDEAVERYVERLALAKAQAGMRRVLWRKLLPHPVLAADTTLEVDGEIVGKPREAAEAHAILERLSGRRHRVLTAVAMSDGERTRSRLSVSEVAFRTLSEHDIRRYIATGEPFDKAGAYGIQGHAAIFIEEIRGSYSGIMGLPLFETAALLEIFGHPVL
ncbi:MULTISPECIES: Maf family protein [Thauera]|jgi:septum formation protein|uniref:dTTP/UTP pyrophosphatase n=2 Tax=Thauera aminoaromatica TaxID=164330 RepID=C4KD01_THASP|nr:MULTISPECIES: Maf family protein [Thauera]OPZ06623.1 MAG: Maf-like protein YhdE [Alphaproteobacteria bacterium ADurb.BinA305]ACR02412.1 maf protein [Thauera aminoaromatica]ENO81750.1 maf protein [Thauera aminoaromatica S2]KIN89389.1 septum formation protein Maf [Thauera sp. SWB20]MBL8461087.1 septum formation inhibitor Maf [Thauera sp.]